MNTVLIGCTFVAVVGIFGMALFIVLSGYPPVKSHTQLTEDIVKVMTEDK